MDHLVISGKIPDITKWSIWAFKIPPQLMDSGTQYNLYNTIRCRKYRKLFNKSEHLNIISSLDCSLSDTTCLITFHWEPIGSERPTLRSGRSPITGCFRSVETNLVEKVRDKKLQQQPRTRKGYFCFHVFCTIIITFVHLIEMIINWDH